MKELYSALSKAQSEIPSIPKNKEALKSGISKSGKPFEYSYLYADLDQVLKLLKPVLSKHGLSFYQTIVPDDKGVNSCCTIICHSSGDSIQSDCPIHFDVSDMQKIGAAITYAKRYSLSMAFGISTDDDLDANELTDSEYKVTNVGGNSAKTSEVASQTVLEVEPPTYIPPHSNKPKYPLSEKQVYRLFAIAWGKGWGKPEARRYVKDVFNKEVEDLMKAEYEKACKFFDETKFDGGYKEVYGELKNVESPMVMFEKALKDSRSGFVDHTLAPEIPPGPPLESYIDEIPF